MADKTEQNVVINAADSSADVAEGIRVTPAARHYRLHRAEQLAKKRRVKRYTAQK